MRDGTQIASVLLNATDAIAVPKQGILIVGWLRCRITQDVRPTRCNRCLGHRAATCKETDRAECCLRCGERGHKAKGHASPDYVHQIFYQTYTKCTFFYVKRQICRLDITCNYSHNFQVRFEAIGNNQ